MSEPFWTIGFLIYLFLVYAGPWILIIFFVTWFLKILSDWGSR